MRILALDLGSTTGWALKVSETMMISSTEEFKPGRHEGAGMQFVRFRAWLDEMARLGPLDLVAYEEVRRHLGVDAAHAYGGYWSHLVAWCQERSVPFAGVPVGTIKKHATGKGNADKAAMISAVRDRLGRPCGDDEADAVALLDYADKTWGGTK